MADHPVPASPVELTDEEIQERAREMYALDQQIRAGLNKGREGLWEAARALHAFDAQSGWSALDYESVRHYCADPEIGISKSTYYNMIAAYDQTVVRRQIDFDRVKQRDRSKVDIVLKKVRAGEKSIDEALDDASALGYRDLRDLYWGPQKDEDVQAPGQDRPDDVDGDETGLVYGLDDEPIEGSVEEDEFDAVAENEAATAPETETAPQFNYGEVLERQVRDALESCRQGLDSPSDLLRRVALEKAADALQAVLNAR
jgi:hypothetical protein